MAILKGNLEFTGGLGNVSAYKMRGLDKTILRTKGGASKKKIMKAPEFKKTRENFTEFSGCAKMGGSIRRSMLALAPVADYNFTPMLSSLAKTIQKLDTESNRGERNIYLSRHRNLLSGFSLNRNTTFESIVKHPLYCVINRPAGTATVQLPALFFGVNFMPGKDYPLFRFMVNLGCVADKFFSIMGYQGADAENKCVYTNWHHTAEAFKATEVTVKLANYANLTDDITLILSVAIQMGKPVTDTVVEPAKYKGCGKIVGVG